MRLVITGCGRSGTSYIAHLLRLAGLNVGHVRACGPSVVFDQAAADEQDVEVSWLAPAYWDDLEAVTVWQITRHPIEVARSYKVQSFFHGRGAHPALVRDVLGFDVLRTFPESPELHFWGFWNGVIEARVGTGIRFRLEDVQDTCDWLIDAVRREIGKGEVTRELRDAVGKPVNQLMPRPSDEIDVGPFPPYFRSMAWRYGYDDV